MAEVTVPDALTRKTNQVVESSMDALIGIADCQAVAVKEQAREILQGANEDEPWKDPVAYPWDLRELPISNERAVQLIAAKPAVLVELKQAPEGRTFLGFGGVRQPGIARQKLGQVLSTAEAMEAGTRVLMILSKWLSESPPSTNRSRTHTALWRLTSGYHHFRVEGEPTSYFLSATLKESVKQNGHAQLNHELEILRLDETQLYDDFSSNLFGTIYDPEEVPADDDVVVLAKDERYGYKFIGSSGHLVNLSPDERAGADRAAIMLTYMMEPLLRVVNRATSSQVFDV